MHMTILWVQPYGYSILRIKSTKSIFYFRKAETSQQDGLRFSLNIQLSATVAGLNKPLFATSSKRKANIKESGAAEGLVHPVHYHHQQAWKSCKPNHTKW